MYRELLVDPFLEVVPVLHELDHHDDDLYNVLRCALRRRGCGSQLASRKRKANDVQEQPDSKRQFSVSADVAQFSPSELSVRQVDDRVVIRGEHEQRNDSDGSYVKRKFVRSFTLPRGVDVSKLEAKLGEDGILRLTAPCIELQQDAKNGTPIAIQKTREQPGEQEHAAAEQNATNAAATSAAATTTTTTINGSSN